MATEHSMRFTTDIREQSRESSQIREMNRTLNITEFQRGAVELESLPLAVFMELTQNCNLKCPYCRSSGHFQASWNMPLSLFRRVAEEIFPTALLVDLRGWGESTILKEFPEFISITTDYGPQFVW